MARATKTTDTLDATSEAPRKAMISAGITPELHEAVESHRWANRMSKAQVVEEALTEWAHARHLLGGE